MGERIHTERRDRHAMPWPIAPGDDGLAVPCILVAGMLGDEMLTVSLHVAAGARGCDEDEQGVS